MLWSTWVNNCISVGPNKEVVLAEKNKLTKIIKCEDTGELKEYVGCKIERNEEENWIKLTQPVLIKSFKDEFEKLPNKNFVTPAIPNTVLQKTK